MNAIRILFVILLSILIFTHASAEQLNIQSAGPFEGDIGAEITSGVAARISLVSVEEDRNQKSYRWGLTRSTPLKVIQGWYAFDELRIREHGGGGRKIAEAGPMQPSSLRSPLFVL